MNARRDVIGDKGCEIEALALRLFSEEVGGVFDDLAQLEVDELELELARLGPGDVQAGSG